MTTIYTLSHPVSNRIVYIGKTIQTLEYRLTCHLTDSRRHNRRVCTWIRKLTKQELLPVIEEIDRCSDEDGCKLEIFYIELFKSWGFELKNHTSGGEGILGYRHTDQTKKNLRVQNIGENNRFFGKKHTEETKKKISYRNKGRKCSEEFRQKRREIMKDWKPSKKVIDRMIEIHGKRVVQLTMNMEFMAEYYTIREACKNGKFDNPHISDCCKGNRKSHGGCKWMYKEDYNKFLITNIL